MTTRMSTQGMPALEHDPAAPVGRRRRSRPRPVFAAVNGKGAELMTQLLFVTLLPRALGPVDYGTLAMALSVVTVGNAFLTLGNQSVMVRFVPAAPVEEREALARALVTRSLAWTALIVVAGVAAVAIVVESTSAWLPFLVAALVGLALLLDVFATRLCQAALGLGRTLPWAFRYALQNALVIVAALAVAGSGGGVGTVAAVAVGSAGALLLGLAATADLWRRGRERPGRVDVPPGLRRFGLLQGLGGALAQVLYRSGAVIVVLLGGSTREAGFAALALGAGIALASVVVQTSIARLPRLVEAWERDPDEAKAEAVRACRRAHLVVVPAAVLSVPLVGFALPAVAGNSFRGAEAALAPALALVALAPLGALSTQLASLALRPGLRAASTGVGTAVFLVTAALAVPAWGAAGATAAVLAGTAALLAVSAAAFRRVLTLRLLAPGFAGAALTVAVGAWM